MSGGESQGAVLRHVRMLFDVGTVGHLTDGQLLERFLERSGEGAELAFAALVERHGPMVLRVCRKVLADPHDAQDAFQATFLVLVRRAGAVRRRDSVGSWLHGVALRIGACYRSAEARRRRHEQRKAIETMAELVVNAPDEALLGPLLHEELGRLPQRLREPLVLCYLEGLTHEQAAERLQWPVGTVRSRLARGRDRLRGRLVRRGVAPTVALGLIGSGLAAETVRAAIPESLADATVRAAMQFSAGWWATGGAGAVSVRAVVMSEGVIKAMMGTKLKLIGMAVLAAGAMATGAAVVAQQSTPTPRPAPEVSSGLPSPALEPASPKPGSSPAPAAAAVPAAAAELPTSPIPVPGTALTGAAPTPEAAPEPSVSEAPQSTPKPSDPFSGSVRRSSTAENGRGRSDLQAEARDLQSLLEQTTKRLADLNARIQSSNAGQSVPSPLSATAPGVMPISAGFRRTTPAAESLTPPPTSSPFDQEDRLRNIERKLEALAEQLERVAAATGRYIPNPMSLAGDERKKSEVWLRLTQDGFLGRYDAERVKPTEMATKLYLRYLGRRPAPDELSVILKPFGQATDLEETPEQIVRLLLTSAEFLRSAPVTAILSGQGPRQSGHQGQQQSSQQGQQQSSQQGQQQSSQQGQQQSGQQGQQAK